ncbi:SIR2 family protein [Vreelandella titanicae]|uniref:SIR2 family protein n=1 Tax=Vreelandella titanicae TaxID=664683 RepID=UPI0038307DD0
MRKSKKKKRRIQPYTIEKQAPHLKGLNRKGKLSIFLGAGISVSCGLPDWGGLLTSLHEVADAREAHYADDDDVANMARAVFAESFNSVVADCLYRDGLEISESALAIVKSGVRSMVCFNFDDVMEEIYQSECIQHRVVLNGEKFNLNNDHVTIFHPHGYLGRFDSKEEQQRSKIILSKSDYEDLYHQHYCLTNLIQLSMLMAKTVLFVGMSMTDPNIIRLLKKAREAGVLNWHYALMKVENEEYVISQTKRLRAIGVDPVWYKEYCDIPRIIQRLSV